MANRTGPALVPHDQGDQKIGNLGRGTLPADAARRDDIPAIVDTIPDPNGGVGYSGVGLDGGTLVASARHSHPAANPEVEGATLFPARISSPLMRSDVRCILAHGEAFGFGTVWESVTGQSVWQRPTEGQIYGRDSAGNSTIALANSDRIAVWQTGTGDEDKYFGIYEVVDCGLQPNGFGGYTSTRAIIQRALDANTSATLRSGMIFQITGTGVEYEDTFLTLDTADPIEVDVTALSFSNSSSVADDTRTELLTGAQLLSEGATSESQNIITTLTNETVVLDTIFPTLAGTPNLSEIPAGQYEVAAKLRVAADNPAANTVLRVQLAVMHENDTIDSPFATITSPPIRSDRDWTYRFTGSVATPTTCAPTDRIVLIPSIITDSLTAMTVHFIYQDESRSTRITVPFLMPSGTFAGFHNDLGGRDATACHPEASVTQEVGATTLAGGVLTMPSGYRAAVVTGTGNIDGMVGNGTVRVFFLGAVTIRHGQTPASGYPFHLPTFGTGANQDLGFTAAMSSATFQLVSTASINSGSPTWVLIGSLNY